MKDHIRYYRIAGITIRVVSELPFAPDTFGSKFKPFEADGPGEDTVEIRHTFSLPSEEEMRRGKEIYRRQPWAVLERPDSWLYLGISSPTDNEELHKVAVFNRDYSKGVIHHPDEKSFRWGNSQSLTFFPTDQILIAQLLASRLGCYLHSSGALLKGRGLLFMGHSEAGKSTMTKMLKPRAEILCDDRIIVRKQDGRFWMHGTWSHGEVPDVSNAAAPLEAIFFLRKSDENRAVPVGNFKDINAMLLACLIKPLLTAEWWRGMLPLVEEIGKSVPCYDLLFDKSGKIVDVLEAFVDGRTPAAEDPEKEARGAG
jgi:hypothetical protein